MTEDNNWFAEVLLVDRALRVPVGSVEMGVTAAAVEAALGRPPAIRESRFVSWAALTFDELRTLAAQDEQPDEALELVQALAAKAGARDTFLTLFVRRLG